MIYYKLYKVEKVSTDFESAKLICDNIPSLVQLASDIAKYEKQGLVLTAYSHGTGHSFIVYATGGLLQWACDASVKIYKEIIHIMNNVTLC